MTKWERDEQERNLDAFIARAKRIAANFESANDDAFLNEMHAQDARYYSKALRSALSGITWKTNADGSRVYEIGAESAWALAIDSLLKLMTRAAIRRKDESRSILVWEITRTLADVARRPATPWRS